MTRSRLADRERRGRVSRNPIKQHPGVQRQDVAFLQNLVARDAVDHDVIAVRVDRSGETGLRLEDRLAAQAGDVLARVGIQLSGCHAGLRDRFQLPQELGGGAVRLLQGLELVNGGDGHAFSGSIGMTAD